MIGATREHRRHQDAGAKILAVASGSPAADAGMRKGDLVTAVAGGEGRRRDRADRRDPGPPARRHRALHRAAGRGTARRPGHPRLAGRLTPQRSESLVASAALSLGERVGVDVAARLVVHPGDVGLELLGLHPPLLAARRSGSPGGRRGGPARRPGPGGAEDLGDVSQRQEPRRGRPWGHRCTSDPARGVRGPGLWRRAAAAAPDRGDDGPVTRNLGITDTPAARRVTTPGWRDPRLWVGVAIVAVSVLVGAWAFGSTDDTVPVWAAAGTLPAGHRLTADDLTVRRVRFADADDQRRYLPADRQLPADLRSCGRVGEGELLPGAAVGRGRAARPARCRSRSRPTRSRAGSGSATSSTSTCGPATHAAAPAPRCARVAGAVRGDRRRRTRPSRSSSGPTASPDAGAGDGRAGGPPLLPPAGDDRRACTHRRRQGLTWSSSCSWSPRARPGSRRCSRWSASGSDIVLLKRCVDVDDLLASASAGQADAAVVALDAPGSTAPPSTSSTATRSGCVAVAGTGEPRRRADPGGPDRGRRAGRRDELTCRRVESRCASSDDEPLARRRTDGRARTSPATPRAGSRGLGPGGCPGPDDRRRRAGRHARRRAACARRWSTSIPTAGPWPSTSGVLDEVSGLLSAARLSADGGLERGFAHGPARARRPPDRRHRAAPGRPLGGGAVRRRRAPPRGRPPRRPRRGRHRLQPGGRPAGDLLARPGRNHLTLGALDVADEVVVVGTADPVGLSRLARGLVDLRDRCPARRCGSSSTGCAPASAGPSATSSAWSRASPGWPASTSSPTTGPPPTGRWSRAPSVADRPESDLARALPPGGAVVPRRRRTDAATAAVRRGGVRRRGPRGARRTAGPTALSAVHARYLGRNIIVRSNRVVAVRPDLPA